METQHNKHRDFRPVMLLSAEHTGQQLGLCQCSQESVKLRCKQTESHSFVVGWFVCLLLLQLVSLRRDLRGVEI